MVLAVGTLSSPEPSSSSLTPSFLIYFFSSLAHNGISVYEVLHSVLRYCLRKGAHNSLLSSLKLHLLETVKDQGSGQLPMAKSSAYLAKASSLFMEFESRCLNHGV